MIYITSSIFIILINVVPAFMPPTWSVVSFFYIRYGLNLFLITIIGAVSSSIGRYFLANISRQFGKVVLNTEMKKNVLFLGKKLRGHYVKTILFTFLWSISPLASNPLFIAAGFAKAPIRYVLIGFFSGRILSYSFLTYSANIVYVNTRDIFTESLFDWRKIVIELISILLIILYIFIDWEELLTNKRVRVNIRKKN